MTNNSLVSICISAYNHERYIEDCVRSIMAQTYRPFELIITNDGSKDATGEILRRLQKELGFTLIDQENKGYTWSLNNMIFNHAKGEYLLTSFGTDDIMFPFMLDTMMGKIREGADVVTPNFVEIDEHGNDKPRARHRAPDTVLDFKAMFLERDWPASGGMLTKTAYVKAVGGFDPAIRLEDYYILMKLAHAGYRIHSLTQPVFKYRKHTENNSNNTRFMQQSRIRIFEQYKDEPGYDKVMQGIYYSSLKRCVRAGDPALIGFAHEMLGKMRFFYHPFRYINLRYKLWKMEARAGSVVSAKDKNPV